MSKLPSQWLDIELSEVADFIRGITYKKEHSLNAAQEKYVPVIRATNITGSALTFDGLVYVPADNVSDDQVLRLGDVVTASSSGSKEIVGKAGSFLGGDFIGSFGAFCTGIRPVKGMSTKYFGYYFQTPAYRKSVSDLSAGSNINNLKTSDLASQRFSLPPVSEQSRIVEKLEELLTGLDAGVAELKAAQKKLAQYRQSLLKSAVEGALTAEWRANNKPAETGAQLLERILQERRARWEAKQLAKFKEQGKAPPKDWQQKYSEPVQPDTTDLPGLPQGWVWASVDQLAAIGTGVTPLRSKADYFNGGNIPWVTSGALNQELVTTAVEQVTPLAVTECRMALYPIGTLLVAMYGEGKTRGKCSELAILATINQAIAALVLEESATACKSYLKYFLLKSYEDMRKQASGGVQPNLNLQILRSIAVPLPPIEEQMFLGKRLASQFESAAIQIDALEISLKQSTAQRQNILKAAFSGRLVPQDPSDEPAGELLARIRGERATQQMLKKPRGRLAKVLR